MNTLIQKKTTGLVIGKFMPPHIGHEYLFKFASNYVDELYIVVDKIKDEVIPGSLRASWIKELMPNAHVSYLTSNMPQDPSETPEFWNIWKSEIIKSIKIKPDFVIASMNYGNRLASVLNSKFIPLDISRNSINISATKIRSDPLKYFDYIIKPARPHYLKYVCFLGPESTGKSTAASLLAQQYNTSFVPEYANEYMKFNKILTFNDMNIIALAQKSSETALAYMANKMLFIDSNAITTKIYSQILFGSYPPILDQYIEESKNNIYVVFTPNTKFVAAPHRNLVIKENIDNHIGGLDVMSYDVTNNPTKADTSSSLGNESLEFRKIFFNRVIAELDKQKFKYFVIDENNYDSRIKQINAIIQADVYKKKWQNK